MTSSTTSSRSLVTAASFLFSFFSNDAATTEIYTLSLHDALPIFVERALDHRPHGIEAIRETAAVHEDRKSTRLNSSHANISYAVFCLKKKNKTQIMTPCRSLSDYACIDYSDNSDYARTVACHTDA